MLHQLPKHTPPLALMLSDIGSPPLDKLAKALGVSLRTVGRWIKADKAPRSAMLSLFWLTRWGVSKVHCQAHNDAVMQANISVLLLRELNAALDQVKHLKRIGDFGAANEPEPEENNRRSLSALGAHALAALERNKTHWIGEDVPKPAKRAQARAKRKRA